MSPALGLLVATVLCWIMVMVGSLSRTRGWTWTGLLDAFGNRDALPPSSKFAERADRGAKNMIENLVLFGALLLGASFAAVPAEALRLPCAIFVGARLVYAPVLWFGVIYLRTLVWTISLVGPVMIGAAIVARL